MSQVGPVLVINSAAQQKLHVTNKIEVSQIPEATSASGESIVVTINGQVDNTVTSTVGYQPDHCLRRQASRQQDHDRPDVTVPATISSGQGRRNRLVGGGAETREHGWSLGHTTLVGGTGPNQLIGLAGHVRFKPSKSTTLVYAGQPKRRTSDLNPTPPGGTVYRYAHGHYTPISISTIKAPVGGTGHKLED